MEVIRRASLQDARHISSLGKQTFTENFGSLFRYSEDLNDYLHATFSEQKMEHSLKRKNNAYWVAYVDETPVGYAKLKLNSPTEFIKSNNVSQLQKIYVLQDFLSMKIGKGLQDLLIAEARKTGSEFLWLSVLEINERAIRFYEKNNFRNVGSHKFSIGREVFDFIAMSKQLS